MIRFWQRLAIWTVVFASMFAAGYGLGWALTHASMLAHAWLGVAPWLAQAALLCLVLATMASFVRGLR